jgi:aryl-alcohol dehydrogenase-like predicted oxidoreductase
MRTRTLGTTDIDASVIGLGTWAIGGWMWGGTDEQDSIRAIQASLDAGVSLVDTAPVYGFGTSEEIVGKAIQGRREEVVLATKCGLVWHTDKGDHFFDSDEKAVGHGDAERSVYRYLGADSIRYEIEQSLRRLQTDYIDLYQTHWQESTTPIEETMECLLALKKEGKIRAIGVSNCSREQLQRYQAVGPVDAAQEKYNMLDRGLEKELLPHYRKTGVSLLSYSSLALGILAGKTPPEREFEEGDQRRNSPRFSVENRRKVLAMLEECKPIAERHDVTLAQLVIAWTVAQPGVTYALVGARDEKQAGENAAAGDLVLSDNEREVLREIVEKHTPDIV